MSFPAINIQTTHTKEYHTS